GHPVPVSQGRETPRRPLHRPQGVLSQKPRELPLALRAHRGPGIVQNFPAEGTLGREQQVQKGFPQVHWGESSFSTGIGPFSFSKSLTHFRIKYRICRLMERPSNSETDLNLSCSSESIRMLRWVRFFIANRPFFGIFSAYTEPLFLFKSYCIFTA